jgi:hypothetical protein
MLIVQEFNSLHEIDPEFIPALELLLKEEVPNFQFIERAQDGSPETDLFTYFLFFGPTQNTPIGFAQVCLRKIPADNYLSFWQKLWRKICFWNKDHLHWKEAVWNVFGGNSGVCLFDAKFSRSGLEKMQELIHKYEGRSDILAHDIHLLKGIQNFKLLNLSPIHSGSRFVLESLPKSSKSYQDYLGSLSKETGKEIKSEWKKLRDAGNVNVGDFPLPASEVNLPFSQDELSLWESWGGTVLTFEKDKKILGCILMVPGKDGNYFFEPFPLEPENDMTVSDHMYIQYALLKFYDVKEARRCHIFRSGGKLTFTDRKELDFFTHQGFQTKEISENFYSRLEGMTVPL